jgi:hypothetical protein
MHLVLCTEEVVNKRCLRSPPTLMDVPDIYFPSPYLATWQTPHSFSLLTKQGRDFSVSATSSREDAHGSYQSRQ